MTSWTRSYLTNQRSQTLEIFGELEKGLKSSYSKNQISSFKNRGHRAQNLPGGVASPPMCGRGLMSKMHIAAQKVRNRNVWIGLANSHLITQHNCIMQRHQNASAGNRTRAARVAGERSTTEPPMRYKSPPGLVSKGETDRAYLDLRTIHQQNEQVIRRVSRLFIRGVIKTFTARLQRIRNVT